VTRGLLFDREYDTMQGQAVTPALWWRRDDSLAADDTSLALCDGRISYVSSPDVTRACRRAAPEAARHAYAREGERARAA
jgi:hypothetical protein